MQRYTFKLNPVRIQKLYGADGEGDGTDGDPKNADPSGDGNGDGDGGEPKTYDQDYVDSLRGEAAKRRTKGKDAEERAAKAEAALAEREKADMGDLEKAQAVLEEANAKIDELEAKNAQSALDLKNERLRNAVLFEAASQKFNDPADVLGMIPQDNLLDDDGEPDKKAITSELEKLAKKKKYLIQTAGGSGDGGPKDPAVPLTDQAEMEKKYRDQFAAQGRIEVPTP